MSDRYVNMSSEDRARSEDFVKRLVVGQKLKPVSHPIEVTVSSVMAQGHVAITFEESQWPMMYPLPEQFENPPPETNLRSDDE